jgi:hypothetical protein
MGFAHAKKCGDSLTWEYDSESEILSILGAGDMWNYESGKSPFTFNVKKVVFSKDITSIGDYAFYKCKISSEIELPASLKNRKLCVLPGRRKSDSCAAGRSDQHRRIRICTVRFEILRGSGQRDGMRGRCF